MKTYWSTIRGFSLSLLFLLQGCHAGKIALYSIGDSTMASYDLKKRPQGKKGEVYPLRGWGMYLGDHFNEKLTYRNKAISGISSKNFRDGGHWTKIMDSLRRGDFVLIQFGHNDQKKNDSLRYTDPRVAYAESLTKYIKDTRAKGANPILATSIARRGFDEQGELIDSHLPYTLTVLRVAKAEGVPVLDLNQKTMMLIDSSGIESSKAFFLYIAPGIFDVLPEGLKDNTHLNEYGGKIVASLAVEELKGSTSKLKRYLKK